MGGTYRSARLPVRGPLATGRFRQKSTVGGRLSEKKGRRRRRRGKRRKKKRERGEKEYLSPARGPHPCAIAASGSRALFILRGEKNRGDIITIYDIAVRTACMKLEEYQTAKAALEAGALLAPGDSRFTKLIKECDERIAVECYNRFLRRRISFPTSFVCKATKPQRPSYPSSKSKVDWDKLEAEVKKEKDEKLDGDAALNKFFQDIYRDADEDTRRAMSKSFVESNGTVLSTNWREVGLKRVEGSAPDGMEIKKWEY
ncbi:hypothetical protein BHM03_00002424 [Ensete ventricosum]|nr:hypothetical protein BHM03_00002424 [Ensete ventricosum]